MAWLSDIEISQQCKMQHISAIAASIGIDDRHVEPYGKYKAKIGLSLLEERKDTPDGKLILVTAITPTAAGEGKTTTAIGLADGLRKIGKRSAIAMREPSLGPVFGLKGGATGGGYSQVVPMEDINLHFTGDIHAITSANNLLAAMIDNHIHHGNELQIDPERITWKRCMDMNDRQLRVLEDGLGGKANGVPRKDGFVISVASEVMAIFCLAESLTDLKKRLGDIIVGYDVNGSPVTCRMLKADGAMTALLAEAFQPNLVQTLEGTPAFIHGGPFANIAHGCNSVIASRMALKTADYVCTEAGFGADLGAEKFLDIKTRASGLIPSAVVIVATIRALKLHGGLDKSELNVPSLEHLKRGMPNLLRHIHNISEVYQLPCIVAVNRFPSDTDEEVALLKEECEKHGVSAVESDVWSQGGNGAIELAKAVCMLCEQGNERFSFAYEDEDGLLEKLNSVALKIYGGSGVQLTPEAQKDLDTIRKLGYDHLPVCISKTQYSFSDDASLINAPKDFILTVRELRICAGAGFIVAMTGSILSMPGLPRHPNAEGIDVTPEGKITGLF